MLTISSIIGLLREFRRKILKQQRFPVSFKSTYEKGPYAFDYVSYMCENFNIFQVAIATEGGCLVSTDMNTYS